METCNGFLYPRGIYLWFGMMLARVCSRSTLRGGKRCLQVPAAAFNPSRERRQQPGKIQWDFGGSGSPGWLEAIV